MMPANSTKDYILFAYDKEGREKEKEEMNKLKRWHMSHQIFATQESLGSCCQHASHHNRRKRHTVYFQQIAEREIVWDRGGERGRRERAHFRLLLYHVFAMYPI